MPSRALPRPAASPSRPNGRPVREIGQAVLWPLRGHLLAQILSPRLHRRCLLWHFFPAPTLPRLSRPPSAQERTCGPRPWGHRCHSRCRCHDRRRSASPWGTRARRDRGRLRRPRRGNQHGYGRAARGSIPAAYLWLPGKRSCKVATLARSYAGQVCLSPFTCVLAYGRPVTSPPLFSFCAGKLLVWRRSKARRTDNLYSLLLPILAFGLVPLYVLFPIDLDLIPRDHHGLVYRNFKIVFLCLNNTTLLDMSSHCDCDWSWRAEKET